MSDENDLDIDGPDDPEIDTGIPADPKREKRKLSLGAMLRQENEFWRRALSEPIGRRCLWRILQAAKFRESRFGASPTGFPNETATWFVAGQQDVAERLVDSWQIVSFEGVHMMRLENDPAFADAKPPLKGQS